MSSDGTSGETNDGNNDINSVKNGDGHIKRNNDGAEQ